MSPEASPLSQQLARQIEASGPISVAEYMRICNSAYYAQGDVFGVAGDFTTAPEISQMFGEMIGLWLSDLLMRLQPTSPCHYVELGPGRGTLASDIMRTISKFGFDLSAHFVETSEALRAMQARSVQGAQFHDDFETLPDNGPLLIIANEFFDALPVRQFISTHSGWRDRVVGRDRGNRFQAMPGLQASDELVPSEFRGAPPPSIYETCPQASAAMYDIAGRLKRQGGVLLVIDYGYMLPGLGSTLQAVKAHESVDPFENPGQHDLSAHVNFLELANLARMRNLQVQGPTEQGRWLTSLGIDVRAATLSTASPERADEVKSMRDRLVEPDQMGSLFKVLAVTAQDWPRPEGFGAPLDGG